MGKILIISGLAGAISLILAFILMKRAKKDPFDDVSYAPPMDEEQKHFVDTHSEDYQVRNPGTNIIGMYVPPDPSLIEEAKQNALGNPAGLYEVYKDDESIHADYQVGADEYTIDRDPPPIPDKLISLEETSISQAVQPKPKEESPIIDPDRPGIGGETFTFTIKNGEFGPTEDVQISENKGVNLVDIRPGKSDSVPSGSIEIYDQVKELADDVKPSGTPSVALLDSNQLTEEDQEFMQDYKDEMDNDSPYIIDK
jgi:hypothetical protein